MEEKNYDLPVDEIDDGEFEAAAKSVAKQSKLILKNEEKIPKHIAIIMDGNGRWAKSKGLPRSVGHRYGVKTVQRVCLYAVKYKIECLSLYAFSTENWSRPKAEIDEIVKLIMNYFATAKKWFIEQGIQVHFCGFEEGVSDKLIETFDDVEKATKNNNNLILNIMFNYGSRGEIVRAVNRILKEKKSEITEKEFSSYLTTSHCVDPDLLIRTSGEIRISNFMLFQCAYSEIHFTKTLWPSFNEKDFVIALVDYAKRNRRFGGV